jgi:hypothetical protein
VGGRKLARDLGVATLKRVDDATDVVGGTDAVSFDVLGGRRQR